MTIHLDLTGDEAIAMIALLQRFVAIRTAEHEAGQDNALQERNWGSHLLRIVSEANEAASQPGRETPPKPA